MQGSAGFCLLPLCRIRPLLLGMTALVGRVLQDPQRAEAVARRLVKLLRVALAGPLEHVLHDTRQRAGGAGGVGLALFGRGSSYHVPIDMRRMTCPLPD